MSVLVPRVVTAAFAKVNGISANVEGMRPVREAELAQIPPAKHAVVVFGTGDAMERGHRLDAAARVLAEDPEAIAIFSGAPVTNGKSEAEHARSEMAARHGIAPERLFTESAAESTTQNAKFVAQMLAKADVDRATLATSDYHMARARGFMKRALKETGQQSVKLETAKAKEPLEAKERTKHAAREAASRLAGHALWDRFD